MTHVDLESPMEHIPAVQSGPAHPPVAAVPRAMRENHELELAEFPHGQEEKPHPITPGQGDLPNADGNYAQTWSHRPRQQGASSSKDGGQTTLQVHTMESGKARMEDLTDLTKYIAASNLTDALSPPQIAAKLAAIAEDKAFGPVPQFFILAMLAGIYIGFGGIFYTVVTTVGPGAEALPYGISQLAGGVVFCVGIIMVVIAGSDLFTGNCMIMVVGCLAGRIPFKRLMRNWAVAWIGNFCGGLLLAALIYVSGQHEFADGHVGIRAMQVAQDKCARDWWHTFFLATHCNMLVCLAVWIATGGRTVTDKVFGMMFPVSAFVAAGFEHAVANMYFIGIGVILKGDEDFLERMDATYDFPELNWGRYFWNNLIPASLGNIVGGSVLIGAVYWFAYSHDLKQK